MIRLCMIAGLMGLGGCSTMAHADPQPAILVNPSTDTLAELTNTVSKALNGRPVHLSSDSLTRDNRLIVERATHMRGGNPIMGRKIEKPDHFYLMSTGTDCFLKHQQSGEIYMLKTAQCKVMP